MHIFFKHIEQLLKDLELYAKRAEKTISFEDKLKFERKIHGIFVDLHAIFIKRIRKHESRILQEGLDLLDDRERDIYLQRKNGATLSELSKQYHFSRERVLQIEKRANRIMNNFYKKDQLKSEPTPKLDELELSVRTYNVLINAGISTIEELLKTPIRKLITIKNIDKDKFIGELKSTLASYGLKLID